MGGRIKLFLVQLLWFILLMWGGSAFALWYWMHELNQVWHMYHGWAMLKLLYMIPWHAALAGAQSTLMVAGSGVLALLINGFIGWRYKVNERWRILNEQQFITVTPTEKLGFWRRRKLVQSQQAADFIAMLAQRGIPIVEEKIRRRGLGGGH